MPPRPGAPRPSARPSEHGVDLAARAVVLAAPAVAAGATLPAVAGGTLPGAASSPAVAAGAQARVKARRCRPIAPSRGAAIPALGLLPGPRVNGPETTPRFYGGMTVYADSES